MFLFQDLQTYLGFGNFKINLKTLKHSNGNHEGYQVQTLQATFGFTQIIVKLVEKFESKLKTFAQLP